jgi:hypothetical protein
VKLRNKDLSIVRDYCSRNPYARVPDKQENLRDIFGENQFGRQGIIVPKQSWRLEGKRSLGGAAGKLLGVNQSPAMGSLADLDALIVHGR